MFLHLSQVEQFWCFLDFGTELNFKFLFGFVDFFIVSLVHVGLMLFEIGVDFVLGVIPVFIEGGLWILVVVDEVIKLFFVSLVHLIENSIFMFFLECLYFESALLSVIILAIDLVRLHYFVLILKLLLYLLNCPLHVNKIMISKQHNLKKWNIYPKYHTYLLLSILEKIKFIKVKQENWWFIRMVMRIKANSWSWVGFSDGIAIGVYFFQFWVGIV